MLGSNEQILYLRIDRVSFLYSPLKLFSVSFSLMTCEDSKILLGWLRGNLNKTIIKVVGFWYSFLFGRPSHKKASGLYRQGG